MIIVTEHLNQLITSYQPSNECYIDALLNTSISTRRILNLMTLIFATTKLPEPFCY